MWRVSLVLVCLVSLVGQRIGLRLYGTAVAPNVLSASDFTLVRDFRMPLSNVDTSFANGSVGGRIGPDGHKHVFVWGNPVGHSAPDLYELDIEGVTSNVICASNTNCTGVDRAVLYKNWGDISCGTNRATWIAGVKTQLTGTEGISHGIYFDADGGENMVLAGYDYSYTSNSLWTVYGATLDNVATGAITCYGPWQYSATGGFASIVNGMRTHYFAKHPTTGKMLSGGVLKSGAAAVSPGPSMFGGQSFPTSATASGPTEVIAMPNRYSNYYQANVTPAGLKSGTLRSMLYDGVFTYPYEYFAASLTDNRIDPTSYSGVGSWSDNDGCEGLMWFKGTYKQGGVFTCTLNGKPNCTNPADATCTHEFYANYGQISMFLSSVSGFSAGEQVRGGTSKARATLDDINATDVGIKVSQTSGSWTNGETITGQTSAATCLVASNSVGVTGDSTVTCTSHTGTFSVGEIAVGGTSNRFMKVSSWTSGTETLIGTQMPNFSNGETITGQTSGATATLTTVQRHNICTHGFSLPIDVTGPGTTYSAPVFLIMDEAKLNAVAGGSATDYDQIPDHFIDLTSQYSLVTAPQTDSGGAKFNTGFWQIPSTTQFVTVAPHADCTRGAGCSSFSETLGHMWTITDAPSPEQLAAAHAFPWTVLGLALLMGPVFRRRVRVD